jgi:fructose-1,6-bisphosphatase/inositol monophosphatase family enzyme/ADP-ribosylglycohydrolase
VESFAPYLEIAIKAARAAGDLLRADFHRPSGPRGKGENAPADTEAEQVIRDILLGEANSFGFLGEETGQVPGAPGAPTWVVDPNDGTRDYIKGRRGSSVSIALVAERRPVLGVVHPFCYPDDSGAIYSAADGREGVWKNGAPVPSKPPERLTDSDVVLVSGGGDRAARSNLLCTKPARVMSIPSIAHRLARVAAGEASATTSLYSPRTWDFAAGHCLLMAAGGVILDGNGNEPAYDDEGSGTVPRLFAGSRRVALALSSRNWDLAFSSERETSMPIVRLRKGGAVADPALVSRAQGALLGHLVGSSFGALFSDGSEDAPAHKLDLASIKSAALKGRRTIGQMGATGELVVATARSLLDLASDARSLRLAYSNWAESSPPDRDRVIDAAVKGQPLGDSLSASALARVTSLTLWGHAADPAVLAAAVRTDTGLTHPSAVAGDASVALAITLQQLLQGQTPSRAIEAAHSFARRSGLAREVIEAVADSTSPLGNSREPRNPPNAVKALRSALFHLGNARSYEEAVEAAIDSSPYSDVLPAVVGSVVGARFGRDGIRHHLRSYVLSCRPMEGLAPQARPSTYWATDAMAMAEALLSAR